MMDSYYTLSELLKKVRIEKELSIHEAEKHTHIRSEYIEALEDADYDQLPADIYIRGILKNYAEFLGLPYGQVIALYRKDSVFMQDRPVLHSEKSLRRISQRTVFLLGKFAFGFIALLFLGFISWYFISQYKNFSVAPQLVVESPKEEQVVYTSDIVLHGATEIDSKLFINGQEAALEEEGVFDIPYTLHEGKNVIEFMSESVRNEKSTTITRNVFLELEVVSEEEQERSSNSQESSSESSMSLSSKSSSVKIYKPRVVKPTVSSVSSKSISVNDESVSSVSQSSLVNSSQEEYMDPTERAIEKIKKMIEEQNKENENQSSEIKVFNPTL